MILTVAIPTYNRPEKAKNTILDLVPQLNGEVKIMVLDNHSDVVIGDFVGPLIPQEKRDAVTFIRHRVNIGGDPNFARCFELCDTEYIWVLGDDDKVMPDAISLILQDINQFKHLDLIGFNFNSNCVEETVRTGPKFLQSTNDFVYRVDSFGNCETLSTSVYRTKEYAKYLYNAAWGTYSMASQFVPAIMAMSRGKVLVLSEKTIVQYIRGEDEHAWVDYQLALGIVSLLEMPIGLKDDEYKAFGKLTSRHYNFIWPTGVLHSILHSVDFDVDLIDNYHIYIYKILTLKGLEFRTDKAAKLRQYSMCLFFLKNKRMLKLMLKLRPGIKQNALKAQPFHLFKRNVTLK